MSNVEILFLRYESLLDYIIKHVLSVEQLLDMMLWQQCHMLHICSVCFLKMYGFPSIFSTMFF